MTERYQDEFDFEPDVLTVKKIRDTVRKIEREGFWSNETTYFVVPPNALEDLKKWESGDDILAPPALSYPSLYPSSGE